MESIVQANRGDDVMGFLYRRPDSKLWWVCWTDSLGERHRESTGLTDLGAARRVLEDVELRQPHAAAPAANVERLLFNYLTRAELERLISHPRVDWLRRCQWAMLALTGARVGEMLCLRVRHCDLQRQPLGRLLVTGRWDSKKRLLASPRSGLPREVPLHRALAAMLLRHVREVLPHWLGRAVSPDDFLFPAQGGGPQQAGTTLAHLQRDLDAAGLRRGNLHTLRRTFFALGRQAGSSPGVLRLIGGEGRPEDPDVPFPARCAEIARLELLVAPWPDPAGEVAEPR